MLTIVSPLFTHNKQRVTAIQTHNRNVENVIKVTTLRVCWLKIQKHDCKFSFIFFVFLLFFVKSCCFMNFIFHFSYLFLGQIPTVGNCRISWDSFLNSSTTDGLTSQLRSVVLDLEHSIPCKTKTAFTYHDPRLKKMKITYSMLVY